MTFIRLDLNAPLLPLYHKIERENKIQTTPTIICFISIKYHHYLFLDLDLNNNLEFTVARIVEITVRREDRYAETLAVDTQQELQSLVDTRSD